MDQPKSEEIVLAPADWADAEPNREIASEVDIEEDQVDVLQSSISRVNAERVSMDQSAAVSISAQDVSVENSAAVFVETSEMDASQNNFLMFTNANEAAIRNSQVGTMFVGTATIDRSASGIIAAREVRAGSIRTGILLAGRVEGPVETLLDTPQVLLAGLAAGIALGLSILLGNIIVGKRR